MCNIAFIVTTGQRSHLLKDLIWRGTGLLEALQSQACVFRWLGVDRSVVRGVDTNNVLRRPGYGKLRVIRTCVGPFLRISARHHRLLRQKKV